MLKNELIIGLVMLALGIGPASSIILYGWPELEPTSCRPQLIGCRATDTGGAQFIGFWHFISIFLLGIGVWFVIAGLTSKAIVSRLKT